jgi:hypothetical protein
MANVKQNPFKFVLRDTHRATFLWVKTPAVFKNEDGTDGDAKYSCTFLIDPNSIDIQQYDDVIKALYNEAKESKFKGLPITSNKLWKPLRDGADWLEEHPEAVEFENMMFLKASTKSQPSVFDQDGNEMIDLSEIKSGDYVRASLTGYTFNKAGNRGFGFFLNSIKLIESGEALGGSIATHDDYDDEPVTKARPTTAAAKPKPVAKAKPATIEDVDADDTPIFSDDNGATWYY